MCTVIDEGIDGLEKVIRASREGIAKLPLREGSSGDRRGERAVGTERTAAEFNKLVYLGG